MRDGEKERERERIKDKAGCDEGHPPLRFKV